MRVPEGDRFEVRTADGAANPYLLQACLLAAGLWGLEKKVDANDAFMAPHVNMYLIPDGAPEIAKIERLPANMLDALREMEGDEDLKQMFGKVFVEAFLKIKKAEWADFCRHLSAWELEKTLDC